MSLSSPQYKLAGAKHSLYHPKLPSLRRMEMDSVSHKLTEEHSRTSTPCTPEMFHDLRFSAHPAPAEPRLPSLEITDTGRKVAHCYRPGPLRATVTPGEGPSLTQAAADWSKCVSSSGEFQLRDLKRQVLGYSGYAVRHLTPNVTASWKFCLGHSPSLDRDAQRPQPDDALNTFRTFGSSYSWSTYLRPWH